MRAFIQNSSCMYIYLIKQEKKERKISALLEQQQKFDVL